MRTKHPLLIRIAAVAVTAVILISVISVIHYAFRQKIECYSAKKHTYSEEKMEFTEDGQKLYGVIYKPDDETGPFPTIIMSHGFNASADLWDRTARSMAESGYACCCFDFRGGNTLGRSDGSMLEMSILTEKADLSFVIGQILQQSFTDTSHLYLMGESLGGCVTAITAPDFVQSIRGIVLYYPALNLQETVKETYPSLDDIPGTGMILGKKVGRIFYADAWKTDIFSIIKGYTGPVLLIHGSDDAIVDVSVSERASEIYANAQLIELAGEIHGFTTQGKETAALNAYEFFEDNG